MMPKVEENIRTYTLNDYEGMRPNARSWDVNGKLMFVQATRSVLISYPVFIISWLVIGSGVIGVYYGWYKKNRTINEYILGDQTFIYPTIMSIIITLTSPKQMLADPTEVVMFGTQFGFANLLGYTLGCAVFIVFFLPVLLYLTGRSLFEYFELRHNKTVRMIAAALSLFNQACLLPVLIYLPSIVMEKMLGVPNFYSSVSLVLLCLFYTMGGVRAVIWTDTLQYGYYFFTVVFCLFVGVYQVGGVSRVWQDNLDGDRIEFFNMGTRLFLDRTSFGSIVGSTMFALSIGLTNQTFYQRIIGIKEKANPINSNCIRDCYRATPRSHITLKILFLTPVLYRWFRKNTTGTNEVVLLSYFGTTLSRLGGILTGLVVYSYFKNCHPLLTKEISKPDQIVAQFINKIAETIPGVLGLFSAGVIAASLSTLSSWLNTMAYSVHDDFVLRLTSRPITRKLSILMMQSVVFLLGIGALAATPLYGSVQSFMQLIIATNAVINGGVMGMFVASMVNPWVTSQGLVTGALAGVALPIWMALSSIQLETQGKLIYYPKLLTTTGCNQPRFGGNFTEILKFGFGGQGTKVFLDSTDFITKFSAVSFHWYLPSGIVTTLVVSAIASFCAGGQDVSGVDPKLIIPQLRWLLPKKVPQPQNQDEQESVPLKTIT